MELDLPSIPKPISFRAPPSLCSSASLRPPSFFRTPTPLCSSASFLCSSPGFLREAADFFFFFNGISPFCMTPTFFSLLFYFSLLSYFLFYFSRLSYFLFVFPLHSFCISGNVSGLIFLIVLAFRLHNVFKNTPGLSLRIFYLNPSFLSRFHIQKRELIAV